jgi:hypothetical protein
VAVALQKLPAVARCASEPGVLCVARGLDDEV